MEGAFTCSFTRRDCTHDPIFQGAYQRTNRTRENKILRCFPHCCYGHLQRSYCGASLHLQVDFHVGSSSSSAASSNAAAVVRQPHADDDVLVFARFRPSANVSLAVGDRVASHTLLSSLQSDANPSGEWIEGRLLASAHQNAWLFELNRSARWYYCWGSSAATTSRNTDHVLEVFVFLRKASASVFGTVGDSTVKIVATTCSLPFKLMSFRRSAAVAEATSSPATAAATTSVLTKRPLAPPPPPLLRPPSAETKRESPLSNPRRQHKVATPLEELTVVIAFAKMLSLAQLTSGLSQLHRQVVEAIGLPSMTQGSPGKVFEQTLRDAGAIPSSTSPQRPQTLVDVAASIVVWLAADPEIQSSFRRTLERAAANVRNKAWLVQIHSEWISWLRSRVDQFLSERHQRTQSLLPPWSVAMLVREILRCSEPPDQELAELGFRGFVAQVSQLCVAHQLNSKITAKRLRPLSPPSTHSVEFPSLPSLAEIQTHHSPSPPPAPVTWWACVIQDLHVESLDPSPATTSSAPTLTVLLWFWRQLACVSITSSSATTLSHQSPYQQIACVEIRSAMSSHSSSTESGMRLLLDGQPRWAATLPSGDASSGCRLLNDLCVGDYMATLDKTTGDLTVKWFAWQATPRATGAVWTGAWCLCVRLAVANTSEMVASATVERGSLDSLHRPFDESMSAAQRLHHIHAWTPQWCLRWCYRKM